MFELDKARELPWRDYVSSQVRRVDDRVLPPPPDIAVYFGSHKEAFAEMHRHPETPELFAHQLLVMDILVAHALAHKDWDDLGAAWEIQRSLWKNRRSPHSLLRDCRLINAAARKLRPPAPPWFAELMDFDVRRAFADAAEAKPRESLPAEDDESLFDRIGGAYFSAAADDWDRAMATVWKSVAASRECGLDVDAYDQRVRQAMALWNVARFRGRTLQYGWLEAARFTAERELTAKILEIKAGRTPSTSSRCSDGQWIVTPGHLRFSKPIEGFIPLEY